MLHFIKGEATSKVPVWRMISLPVAEIERRAYMWAGPLGPAARITGGESVIGGGSLPGATLPTRLVAIGDPKKPGLAQKLARSLRLQDPSIVGRISENVLLLDPRTVRPEEDQNVISGLKQAVEEARL